MASPFSAQPAGFKSQHQTHLRPGAKAFITSSERVLLIKERHSDGTPFWTLPGGGIQHNESVAAGLKRELREELNCQSRVGELLTTFCYAHSQSRRLSQYIVFTCQVLSDIEPSLTEGVIDYRWVDSHTLPPRTIPQVRSVCRQTLQHSK